MKNVTWSCEMQAYKAAKKAVRSLVARGYEATHQIVVSAKLAAFNLILTKAQAKASAKVAMDIAILRGGGVAKPVVSLSWLKTIIGTRKVSLVVVQRNAGVSQEETSVRLTPTTKASMEARAAVARVKARVTAAVCKGMEIKGYIVSLSCRATRGLVAQIVEAVGNTTGLDFNTLINRGLSVFSRYERTGVVVAA